MAKKNSHEIEENAVTMVAALMAATSRTAPKTRGIDSIDSLYLKDDDLAKLALAMEKLANKKPDLFATFRRDTQNVRESACVLLIGVIGEPKNIENPLDCGACGYASCEQLAKARNRMQAKDFVGPICMFQSIDLGIALGAAVKLAAEFCIDNRIMYTIGAAAKDLGLLDSDVIMGIPLAVAGKSPYFDRG